METVLGLQRLLGSIPLTIPASRGHILLLGGAWEDLKAPSIPTLTQKARNSGVRWTVLQCQAGSFLGLGATMPPGSKGPGWAWLLKWAFY